MTDHESLSEPLEGVLIVDKPLGPTSHDVVGKLRRTLRMRRIGHAGTLDPLASGVLVVLLGQATKLGPYLTLHDKHYDARVVFGRSTDTLDAQGNVTSEMPLPPWLSQEIEQLASSLSIDTAAPRMAEAITKERMRTAQTPPAYSAIKVSGERSYDRARRGESVTLEDRPVEVSAIDLRGAGFVEPNGLGFIDVSVDVSKGYYVRSLARDIGQTLGVPSFLGALRRTRSGPFEIEESVKLDAARSMLEASILPLAKTAARCMSTAVLTTNGVTRASQGKLLSAEDFSVPPAASEEPSAWLSPDGCLVAVGGVQPDGYVVRRGFTANLAATTDAYRV